MVTILFVAVWEPC